MTREELIECLRCCSQGFDADVCKRCLYYEKTGCVELLARAAADMLESDLHESKSENDDCQNCIHQRICDLWMRQESQDASCFVDDCFMAKQKETEKTADDMFRELGYERAYRGFSSVTYQKSAPDVDPIIEINKAHKLVHISNGYESYTIPFDVLNAACKAVDEMEGVVNES